MLKENLPSQRALALALGTSASTINKIINKNLDLKKTKKHNVHRLLPRHIAESTTLFLEKLRNETGIKAIPFGQIPVKSPDASPMDFCAFGLLKQALSKRKPETLDGLWKVVEDEWSKLSIVTLRKSLLSWKIRCRSIVQNKGYQIEHLKNNNYGLNK